jgi:hypothetical protein
MNGAAKSPDAEVQAMSQGKSMNANCKSLLKVSHTFGGAELNLRVQYAGFHCSLFIVQSPELAA